jgi:Tfp pilus assembly protein PilF
MVNSAEIIDLKRIVAKNPKSLAFAWLADLLRVASSGDKQKLDEALLTVNKGLEINSNFLPGRLARGRILLEKGDLTGAKADFEVVAEQDSFCSSAQKLFLETSEKLGQSIETEVYQKILGALEPGVVVKVRSKTESVGVNAALDDLLSEEDSTDTDDKEDIVISNLLLQTFENIFEPSKQEQPPDIVPYSPPAPKPQPAAPKQQPVPPKAPAPAPDIDALVKEQLVSKVENIPDLTGDIDSLLASASALPPVSGALSPPSPPDVDALIKEQLKSKVDNVPDLTGDIDSLLASAPTMSQTSGTLSSPSSPDLDALIKEQLTSKMENLPDLTGDIDSLLTSASDVLSASGILTAPSSPDIDALVEEQLTSRVDNIPDLTGDINSLLASMPVLEPSLEPSLSASYSLPLVSNEPSPPDVDALIKEQLKSKVDNIPDLTGDIDSLLASSSPSSPSPPDVDALVKEQLSSKVEDIPDLTGDIDSLLASIPASDSEPELVPYVPPGGKADSLTQTPTLTLAELYMDQGLPQKAAGVYKELLMQDPNNADLKTKLALVETQM